MWEFTDPQKPTFTAGAVGAAIMLAVGNYIPEGVLPENGEEHIEDQDLLEFFLVHVTEERELGEHMALLLDIGTARPGVVADKFKNNIRSLTDKAWGKGMQKSEKTRTALDCLKRSSTKPMREVQTGYMKRWQT